MLKGTKLKINKQKLIDALKIKRERIEDTNKYLQDDYIRAVDTFAGAVVESLRNAQRAFNNAPSGELPDSEEYKYSTYSYKSGTELTIHVPIKQPESNENQALVEIDSTLARLELVDEDVLTINIEDDLLKYIK